ncbi:Uncharacterised protein [Escherichia coli]|nr:Uncharacterised protein [Escherichia coli]SQN39933.1 Uncharacterised protein [Escherichia coli]
MKKTAPDGAVSGMPAIRETGPGKNLQAITVSTDGALATKSGREFSIVRFNADTLRETGSTVATRSPFKSRASLSVSIRCALTSSVIASLRLFWVLCVVGAACCSRLVTLSSRIRETSPKLSRFIASTIGSTDGALATKSGREFSIVRFNADTLRETGSTVATRPPFKSSTASRIPASSSSSFALAISTVLITSSMLALFLSMILSPTVSV